MNLRSFSILRPLVPAAAVAAACLGCGAALAQALPVSDQPQVTADPPVRVPDTARCDEVVLENKFDGFYVADPDPVKNPDDRGGVRFGQHRAGACPGPWSKVVLNADVYVNDGTQFDRVFEIYLGNAPLLSSSTAEGVGEGTNIHWHVETDVSRFAGLLNADQVVTGIINNAHWDGYFGIFNVKLTLSYYAADAGDPAIDAPDYILALYPKDEKGLPVNHQWSGYGGFDASTPDRFVSYEVNDLPRNLVSLYADLRAQGHGANEEFWQSNGVKRQVELRIDGQIAGFAPLYPVLFTGANGPGNWMPIPSPRAFHLDPYRVDLTPFVGLLVDGKPHRFELHVPDAVIQDDDYWMVGGTLFGETDPALGQTSGELSAITVDEAAIESSTGGLMATAERSGSWKGFVVTSAGRVDSEVSNHFDFSAAGIPLVYNNAWNWTTVSRLGPQGGEAQTTTRTYRYTMDGTLGAAGAVPSALTLGDAGTVTVEGPQPYSSSFELRMTTSGIGLANNIAQAESWCGQDSSGWSYNRLITAAGGIVLSDQQGLTTCVLPALPVTSAPQGSKAAAQRSGYFGGGLGGSLLLALAAMGGMRRVRKK